MESVDHARATQTWIRTKRYIAQGDIAPPDGKIKHTPNDNHPEHHTFWRDMNSNLHAKFQIIINPQP